MGWEGLVDIFDGGLRHQALHGGVHLHRRHAAVGATQLRAGSLGADRKIVQASCVEHVAARKMFTRLTGELHKANGAFVLCHCQQRTASKPRAAS